MSACINHRYDVRRRTLDDMLTSAGLWLAVIMTPIVRPSSFLLRRTARIPTRNIVEPRVCPLQCSFAAISMISGPDAKDWVVY